MSAKAELRLVDGLQLALERQALHILPREMLEPEAARRADAQTLHDAVRKHRQQRAGLGAEEEHEADPAAIGERLLDAARLTGEVFGPILHVVRWQADRLDQVLDEIAATGYGLTLGIHSRIDETVRHILARLKVGNSYINRSMIGAVVGVQPFGGEGLSGTGPKAGGPRYLHRFATERTISTDTTAAGGNATLLSLQEEI